MRAGDWEVELSTSRPPGVGRGRHEIKKETPHTGQGLRGLSSPSPGGEQAGAQRRSQASWLSPHMLHSDAHGAGPVPTPQIPQPSAGSLGRTSPLGRCELWPWLPQRAQSGGNPGSGLCRRSLGLFAPGRPRYQGRFVPDPGASPEITSQPSKNTESRFPSFQPGDVPGPDHGWHGNETGWEEGAAPPVPSCGPWPCRCPARASWNGSPPPCRPGQEAPRGGEAAGQ